ERTRLAPPHDSSAMVKMEVREDYGGDVAGLHSERLEPAPQPTPPMVENLALDHAQPVADSRIDYDRVAAAQDQRTGQVKSNAVLIVGRMFPLPQFARNYAEHAAAV